MRVGVYAPALPPQIGGGYRFMEEVLNSLQLMAGSSRHEFVVLTHSPRAQAEQYTSATLRFETVPSSIVTRGMSKVRRICARVVPGLAKGPPVEDRLKDWLAAVKIDFLYHPTPAVLTTEIPYAVTVWDLQHRLQPFFPEVSAGGTWEAREEQYSRNLRRAAYVLTGTDAGVAEIERFFGIAPERVRRLPHPTPKFALNPPPLDPTLCERYGLARDFLFYPAQFWAHKNHVTILRAIARLRDKHGIRQSAVFSGSDQGNESYVRQVVSELKLDDQVRFLGFVPFEDVIQLYRNALGLCYMSLFGPENLPPLEAFGLGCPVIASSVSGASEQLGDAVISVDALDEGGLVDAILRLRQDAELRKTLIERGKVRAGLFTSTDYVRGMIAVCDEFAVVRSCWKAA